MNLVSWMGLFGEWCTVRGHLHAADPGSNERHGSHLCNPFVPFVPFFPGWWSFQINSTFSESLQYQLRFWIIILEPRLLLALLFGVFMLLSFFSLFSTLYFFTASLRTAFCGSFQGYLHNNDFVHRDIKPENFLLQNRDPDVTWFQLNQLNHCQSWGANGS